MKRTKPILGILVLLLAASGNAACGKYGPPERNRASSATISPPAATPAEDPEEDQKSPL